MKSTGLKADREVGAVSPSEPQVAIDDLQFAYTGGGTVIKSISMRIEPSEVVGIVGPSGCGKSTFLAAIAGLVRPTGGTIEYRSPSSRPRHKISMVFQKDTLSPWLTVEENVRMFTKFREHRNLQKSHRRMDAASRVDEQVDQSIDERVRELLALVHLEDAAKAYPHQLSGGMRRRAQFLAGVAPRPEVLLLDEPFSAIDEPSRIGIHQDVLRVIKAQKMTTILVTHDLAEAVTLCDRIFVLSNRPAIVAAEHTVNLVGRDDLLRLRGSEAYVDSYREVWDDLSRQIRASSDVSVGEESK